MPRPDHIFVPVTRADFPLLRRWLSGPHVREWRDPPERELEMISRELEDGAVGMRVVHHGWRPFACVQDCPAHHREMPHYADFPPGTRAMDTFRGEPDMLGRGHAACHLRARAGALPAQGFPAVVIDPGPASERAVRAHRRAGFTGDRTVPWEDGDPVIVMEFRPS